MYALPSLTRTHTHALSHDIDLPLTDVATWQLLNDN